MTHTARSRTAILAGCLVVLLAACYGCAGPGVRPVSEVVAGQCDVVRSIGSLIAIGEAFVDAFDRGDRADAETLAERAQAVWFRIQAGFPFGPDGSPPPGFEERQLRIGAARPRFEWFAAVMRASPIEDAAGGTARMLPEMRTLLDGIDLPECAVIEMPSGE